MSLAQTLSAKVIAPALELLMGRRNLVRFARSLTMSSRRDLPNGIDVNGELLVQDVVLRNATARPVVVLDIGANKGEWSRRVLARSGDVDVQIHAFEPASATFARLTENLASAGSRVRLVKQALSSRQGEAEFFIAGEEFGINSLHARDGESHAREVVPLNTVDEYCHGSGITRVQLMKVDAEGHDFFVLEGAKGMLQAGAVEVLQFEYNQRWIDSRHFLKDVFDLLAPLGYSLGKITPQGIEFYPNYNFELESFREGNYLACRKDWERYFPQVRWWNLA